MMPTNRTKCVAIAITFLLSLYTTLSFSQINTGGPVGTLEGGASVSLDGAATYSVPIKVPKGINGMQPSLNLVYSSRATDGNAGWGWSLSGLSSISRGNQTKFHNGKVEPVKMNADDNFYLDGQLLMPVTGTNGGDGTVYKTEAETYAKIESFGTVAGDPDWWKLTAKDGSITEYGKNITERMRAEGNFIWLVSNARDVNDNTVTYNYAGDDTEPYLNKHQLWQYLCQL